MRRTVHRDLVERVTLFARQRAVAVTGGLVVLMTIADEVFPPGPAVTVLSYAAAFVFVMAVVLLLLEMWR